MSVFNNALVAVHESGKKSMKDPIHTQKTGCDVVLINPRL